MMEFRDWAIRILSADTLEDKLFAPQHLTDKQPGSPCIWQEPSRPAHMQFQRHSRDEKLPPFHEHMMQDKRAACLHRFAGHELLAVEIMAFALLAFPEAPRHFRRGLAHTLQEEQGHVRLYIDRLSSMGVAFGDLPLYRHFWTYTPFMTSPLRYISIMSLTFEMANLDFAPLYGKSFARHGDDLSAALMQQILQDELSHVAFGWHWLQKTKSEGEDPWTAWTSNLPSRLSPSRAKGFLFFEENRRMAGLPEDWIANLKNS